MTGLAIGALVGGLTGSPHCVSMCGGFAAAASAHPVAYHLGRLLTYVVLGTIAGAVGSAIPGPPWVTGVFAVLMLTYFCLRLADLIPAPKLGSSWVVRTGAQFMNREGALGRFGLGAVTALLPCGLVWAALGIAVGANHTLGGAVVMGAFWLGTVPLLATVAGGFGAFVRRGRRARVALAGMVFAAGLWSISGRVPMTLSGDDPSPACHTE